MRVPRCVLQATVTANGVMFAPLSKIRVCSSTGPTCPLSPPTGPNAYLAHWLSYSADERYSYDILLSQSEDDGESWSTPLSPHDDGTPTEHGFVSLFPGDNATGLVWLDGRNTPDAGMTLRSATLSKNMTFSNEAEIDGLVCDCCQTSVAVATGRSDCGLP